MIQSNNQKCFFVWENNSIFLGFKNWMNTFINDAWNCNAGLQGLQAWWNRKVSELKPNELSLKKWDIIGIRNIWFIIVKAQSPFFFRVINSWNLHQCTSKYVICHCDCDPTAPTQFQFNFRIPLHCVRNHTWKSG